VFKQILLGLVFITGVSILGAQTRIVVFAQSSTDPFPDQWKPWLTEVVTGEVMDKLFDMGFIAVDFAVQRTTSNPNWTLSLWEHGVGFGPAPVYVVHLRWEYLGESDWKLSNLEIGKLTQEGWEFKHHRDPQGGFSPDKEAETKLGLALAKDLLGFFQ